MKDRFKFRVWNKVKGKFEDPKMNDFRGQFFLSFVGGVHIAEYPCGNGDNAASSVFDEMYPDNWVIQQSTGVRDVNNVLIFEGDIIKTLDSNLAVILGDVKTPKYDKGQIEFVCQEYQICQSCIGAASLGDYVFCDCCPQALEIIGNIFENEELLK